MFILLKAFYPINFLRNVAMVHTASEYVLIVDVDLVPCYNCYKDISTRLAASQPNMEVWVVPAFEIISPDDIPLFPRSKQELLALCQNPAKQIQPFQ